MKTILFKISIIFGALVTVLLFQNCGQMKPSESSSTAAVTDQTNSLNFGSQSPTGYVLNLDTMQVHLADNQNAPAIYQLNREEIIALLEAYKSGQMDLEALLAELASFLDQYRGHGGAAQPSQPSSPRDPGGSGIAPQPSPSPAPTPSQEELKRIKEEQLPDGTFRP